MVMVMAMAVPAGAQPADPPVPPDDTAPPTTAPPPAPEPAPEPPPPPAPPPAPPAQVKLAVIPFAPGPYPRALVARPLVLPDRAVEGTLRFAMEQHEKIVSAQPRVRGAVARVELEGAADVALGPFPEADLEPDHLVHYAVAARYALDPDLAVGGELGVASPPAGNPALYQPRLVVSGKHRFGGRGGGAIELAALAGEDRVSDFATAVASGRLRVEAQVVDAVAIAGDAALTYNDPLGSNAMFESFFTQSYGGALVIAADRRVDVIAEVAFLSSGDASFTTFAVGIAGRLLP